MTRKQFTSHLLATTAALAGLATIPVAAHAQGAASAGGVSEVVVTARKREENLQKVPLSITAIGAQTLEDQGVSDLRDIVTLTPGLTISEFGAGTLVSPIIRGLSQLTGGQFAENNVASFYNGVYIQNNNLIDTSFLDIQRVEVIKGPVSSLYGRNAYAGVINYVTKRPSDKFEGSIRGIAGKYGRRSLSGTISGPIAGDVVKARLGSRYDESDGSWRDPVSGVTFEGFRKFAVQGAVEIDPSQDFNLIATAFYAKDTLDQPARVAALGNCGAPAGAFQPTFCGKIPDYTDSSVSRSANPSFDLYGAKRELFLATNEINFKLGGVDVKSLTSYGNNSYGQNRDQDGTGVGFTYNLSGPPGKANLSTYTYSTSDDESFSQEVRASFNAGEKLRFQLGGFYNNYKADTEFTLTIDGSSLPAGVNALPLFPIAVTRNGSVSPFIQRVHLEDREYSGFGVVDFSPTEKLTLTGEARWSNQRKFQNQAGTFLTGPSADPDGPNGIGGTFKFWSYRFTGDYQLTPITLLYASAAKGTKAGGFNSGSAINTSDVQYDPEINWTYEAGVKTKLWDGKATLDVSVFYSNLSDIQLFGFQASGLGSVITNSGDGKSYGFEAGLNAQLAPGVSLGLGLAYANPEFKTGSLLNSSASVGQCRNIPACAGRVVTIGGKTSLDLGGLSFPRESDWQYTSQIDVIRPLTETLSWTLNANYKYQSSQYSTTPPTNVNYIGARKTLNLRAGLAGERWTFEGYVNNALDDGTALNFGSGLNASNFQSPISIVYGAKRSYGVEASFKF